MSDFAFEGFLKSQATLSECGTYRYQLWRPSGALCSPLTDNGTLLWIMLNPSTADASVDDPTIRKCIGFTRRLGYSMLAVGNLFAYRATDPKQLVAAVKLHGAGFVAGPHCDSQLLKMLEKSSAVICGWGAHGERFPVRVETVRDLIRQARKPALRLGKLTDGGHPRHPLYVSYDAEPLPYGVTP